MLLMFHAFILMIVMVYNLDTALLKYSLTDLYTRKQLFAVCKVKKLSFTLNNCSLCFKLQ